ncbi:MAG: T9SS type A sorting domain-containing protein [Bacteroidetes bacterium]|nr:T9SS type A sorting domain-containing protein [Bacteroidota bacterium]
MERKRMMEPALFLLGIFISHNVYCTDWDLFPYRQKSYFSYPTNGGTSQVNLFVMDSMKTVGANTFLMFRKNLNLQGGGPCYKDSVFIQVCLNYELWTNDWGYMDSLTLRNDTVYYTNGFYSSSPFYFLPDADIGQSWTVTSTYWLNDYNQITLTCSGIQEETFLGITDSVKTFTLQANGSSLNQVPVSNFVIRLSKHHGLIEFVPFYLFLYHPESVDFTSMSLIGFESSGEKYGYHQPEFSDYFHPEAGDILMWHWLATDMMGQTFKNEYFRDSITNADIFPDSVVYTFNRITLDDSNQVTYQNGMKNSFLKTGFVNLVDTPPDWIGFGNNQYGMTDGPGTVMFWGSSFLEISIDSLSGDTITTFSFSSDANYIDTTICYPWQVFDVFFRFSLDTKVGITSHCGNNFDENCVTLIGYKTNGAQSGSITLNIPEAADLSNSSVRIYPNPARDYVRLENTTFNKSAGYQVFNSMSQLVRQGLIVDNQIEINGLSSGLYIVLIQSNGEIFRRKFVKE